MMPHMHLRGKSFNYQAHFPDGSKEILLDVPRYDFNWQTAYRLEQPRNLPAGTRIQCVAHFDNSEDNLNNPDPRQTVRWGDQTWEEMMIGYFDIAVPRDEATRVDANPLRDQIRAGLAARGIFRKLDKNRDGTLSRDEVPIRHQATFDAWDANEDNAVTLDEAWNALK